MLQAKITAAIAIKLGLMCKQISLFEAENLQNCLLKYAICGCDWTLKSFKYRSKKGMGPAH